MTSFAKALSATVKIEEKLLASQLIENPRVMEFIFGKLGSKGLTTCTKWIPVVGSVVHAGTSVNNFRKGEYGRSALNLL